jgi:hypothetical protein
MILDKYYNVTYSYNIPDLNGNLLEVLVYETCFGLQDVKKTLKMFDSNYHGDVKEIIVKEIHKRSLTKTEQNILKMKGE